MRIIKNRTFFQFHILMLELHYFRAARFNLDLETVAYRLRNFNIQVIFK